MVLVKIFQRARAVLESAALKVDWGGPYGRMRVFCFCFGLGGQGDLDVLNNLGVGWPVKK